jgi:outer membrane protein, heavy metal efflux system
LCPRETAAQIHLTLADALARAREQAPQIVSARLALEEARGRLLGAAVRLPSNPELDLGLGHRRAEGAGWTDLEVGAAQRFEPFGRRAARIAGARAQVDEATASVDAITGGLLRETATWFYRAVHATERIRLLTASEALATAILDTADRRYRAGDIAVLDVNLARASLARARSAREGGEADLASALGELRLRLRLDQVPAVAAGLALSAPVDVAALARSADQRPELRALDAAIRQADADVAVGRAQSRPDFGLGVRYQREGGEHVAMGGLTVTLPLFARGQELMAVASARRSRLKADLEATRSRVRVELETAIAAYERRAAAARVLETDALPLLDENEALTVRSFAAGQIGMSDLLLIRRETLETRFEYLTTLLEAALARVDVEAAAAVLR